MREDIVGMLKNAIDHGGNPQKVAQSLINSGYPMKDVKEAYDYVISNNPELQAQQAQQVNQQTPQIQISSKPQQISTQTQVQQQYSKPQNFQAQQQVPQQQRTQMPQAPQYKAPSQPQQAQFSRPKPLPSQKINPPGVGKILVLILVLLLLVLALISVIVFKDDILDLLSL
ncbi:MAG: hypothetical protein AABX10_00905 [Nanoarchaeota archaeon]|mgnify:FL=1